jgi:hypothetical protein
MKETVLLGRANQIIDIPRSMWAGHLAETPEHTRKTLAFMKADHHRVRNFAVTELVRRGAPLPADRISQALELANKQVLTILDDLERNLFFLVRNDAGDVSWAFPLTVEPTPHQITFDTGERLYGA